MVNFILCGTPGTGKTTVTAMVKERLKHVLPQTNYIEVGSFAIANGCIEEYDAELETQILDEDKLEDALKPISRDNDRINFFESIHGDILPRWIVQRVFVLVMENHTILYDRLIMRNYNYSKLTNNIECEIFQEIKLDALRNIGEDKVTVLCNDTEEHLESNVRTICEMMVQTVEEYEPI